MKHFLFLTAFFALSLHAVHTVDFDISMRETVALTAARPGVFAQWYEVCKNIYERNHPDSMRSHDEMMIPPIFHSIWLGKKFPTEYEYFYESWRTHHPEWLFIFWTDNPVNYDKGEVVVHSFEELDYVMQSGSTQFTVVDTRELVFDNRVFFDETDSYGERSDILKWEVVYRYGGVYIDSDFECLAPLDELHYRYEFYTGIQPLDTNMVQLGAALYGATPQHPILEHCVETIKDDRHNPQVVIKTGPIHFTRSFIAVAPGCEHVVALPASYFYPCGYEQRGQPAEVWQMPESLAVHHWAGSWLKPEAFVQG